MPCAASARRYESPWGTCTRRCARAQTPATRPQSRTVPGATRRPRRPSRPSARPAPPRPRRRGPRVQPQRLLDLGRIDVLAAAHDHVLDAVGQVQVTVVIEKSAVAARVPAVDDRLGRLVRQPVVAQHHGRRPDPDLARLIAPEYAPVRATDLERCARIRFADGSQQRPAAQGRGRRVTGRSPNPTSRSCRRIARTRN